jgi:DNA-binding NtrC family response regulator
MTKRILIVDDDEYLRQALQQLLELEDFKIVLAADGRETLELMRPGDYDLVLLDVKMPGPNGLDVLTALHAQLPAIPIIMMSGLVARNTVTDALQAGACDFILKPFDDELVLSAVRRALEPAA